MPTNAGPPLPEQPPPQLPLPPSSSRALRTCRRCHARFDPALNTDTSCRHHASIFTGGELAKATGFLQAAAGPEHSLKAKLGRTGLLRFWDCCGAEDPDTPGCVTGRHVTYDEAEQ